MKILLVHPPLDDIWLPVRRTESLGIGYIAAVLRRDGHEVEVLDAYLRYLKPPEMVREILKREFDCLGLTALDVYKKSLVYAAKKVRKSRKDAVIVAGGYFPTFMAAELLYACREIDIIVRGEGEQSACELFGKLAHLAHGEWQDTPGIAYVKDGSPVMNVVPPLISNLDSLPFPARDALGQRVRPTRALISSSRGCFNRCSFCCTPSFFALHGCRVPRFRDPVKVADEIESVIADTALTDFVFADDDFIGPGQKCRERVVRLAEEIRGRKLKDFHFTIECRADEVDEDLLKLLKEAGLTRVFLGIESGVQRQLDTYNKRITVDQNQRAVEIVRNSGAELVPGFIMFDAYSTVQETLDNFEFIRQAKMAERDDSLAMKFTTRLMLFGGAPIVEKLRSEGLIRQKGIFLSYRFKDWKFGLLYGLTQLLGKPMELYRRIARLFGHAADLLS